MAEKHKKKKEKSLYYSVFRSIMIFSVFLLAGLWIMQTLFLELFYKQIRTGSLLRTSDIVYNTLSENVETDISGIGNIIAEIAMQNDISVKIIDTSSSSSVSAFTPVFSVVSDQDNLLNRLGRGELYFIYQNAKENDGEVLQPYQRGAYTAFDHEREKIDRSVIESFSPSDENQFLPKQDFKHGTPPFFKGGITQELLYARIIPRENGEEYLLLCDAVITPLSSTAKTLRSQLVLISIFVLLISSLIAQKVSKRITRPILNINESAKQLAQGNYNERFEGQGYLEISELADTLNYAASEIAHTDSIKRELIANTSHDLRTPLTMIIGYAEVMRDIPGENTSKNVQVIIDEATHLAELVNDMLDLSKLQSGSYELDISEFNLTSVTERIVERVEKLTKKDGFEFVFEHHGNAYVKADEIKITQCIYNFLSNAVNYSGDSRSIIIRQTIKSGKVRLEFIDHGPGIPKEKLPNIWDRYYKIDTSHKRSSIGSGIGLSIIKSILDMHQAKFGVTSSLSSGSNFWFELDVTEVI